VAILRWNTFAPFNPTSTYTTTFLIIVRFGKGQDQFRYLRHTKRASAAEAHFPCRSTTQYIPVILHGILHYLSAFVHIGSLLSVSTCYQRDIRNYNDPKIPKIQRCG